MLSIPLIDLHQHITYLLIISVFLFGIQCMGISIRKPPHNGS